MRVRYTSSPFREFGSGYDFDGSPALVQSIADNVPAGNPRGRDSDRPDEAGGRMAETLAHDPAANPAITDQDAYRDRHRTRDNGSAHAVMLALHFEPVQLLDRKSVV